MKIALQLLNSNIECIKEDLDSWSALDPYSWLTVLSNEDLNEGGNEIYNHLKKFLENAKEWNVKYKHFTDVLNSGQKRFE